MACNEIFGAGEGSQIAPPNLNKYFALSKCGIAIVDRDIRHLLRDFEVIIGLAQVRL